MRITAENGHQYTLDRSTVDQLHRARNAAEAEAVYDQSASHVLARDRLSVWLAVDGYLEIEEASYGPTPLG